MRIVTYPTWAIAPRRWPLYRLAGLGVAPDMSDCGFVQTNATPKDCPTCPPGVSCAVCEPWSCPQGAPTPWHLELSGGDNLVQRCVRNATPQEQAACKVGPSGNFAHSWYQERNTQIAIAAVFVVGILGAGAAVAYHHYHR